MYICKIKKGLKYLIIISILILLFFYFKNSLNKAVIDYANTDVKNIITAIINDSVLRITNDHDIKYNDLIYSEYDPSGQLSSLSINSSLLNIIKSETVLSVLNNITDLQFQSFGIPIGNIIGTSLSSGRGFKIGITIVPLGTVGSEIRNEFVSAGINQTLHRIMIDYTVSVKVLAPFSKASADIMTSICIAETVIIGNVPNTYFNYKG